MNSTHESTFTIQDASHLLSKYRFWILVTSLISMILFMSAAQIIPKKYKVHFVITVYSKYFQSPLIGDFVPGLSESHDMKSQRESLIRQILSQDFLDQLGEKYKIYETGKLPWLVTFLREYAQRFGLSEPQNKESILTEKREDLRKRIEINSLNNTTFNVGFIYLDPDIALKVTRDIYTQVVESLLGARTRMVGNVRNAVKSRLGSLPPPMPMTATASTPAETQSMQNELQEVRQALKVLTDQSKDADPMVSPLRDRERILMSRLSRSPTSVEPVNTQALSDAGASVRDMYGDLEKKLSYLDIALDSDGKESDYFAVLETPLYPAAPLWPNKGLLAVWGFALGFMVSLFAVALKELFDRSRLHVDVVARQVGLPLLGSLPACTYNTSNS